MTGIIFQSIANDYLTWSTALGAAGSSWDPAAHGGAAWATTSAGWYFPPVGVGLALGPGIAAGPTTIVRVATTGRFDPGSSLVGFLNNPGPLELQFSNAISAVGFFISTRNPVAGSAVDATVRAYNTALPPTLLDTPVMTLHLTDTGGGGPCPTLPGVACSDAPFIALDAYSHPFNYLTISTTDANGFYISDLLLDTQLGDVPEPVPGVLIGGGLFVLGVALRKFRVRG